MTRPSSRAQHAAHRRREARILPALGVALLTLWGLIGAMNAAAQDDSYAALRRNMVEEQIVSRGITEPREGDSPGSAANEVWGSVIGVTAAEPFMLVREILR